MQLEQLRDANPADSTWRDRLFEAHVNYGAELAGNGALDAALAEFDAAVTLKPYHTRVHEYRALVTNYVTGVAQYEAEDWDRRDPDTTYGADGLSQRSSGPDFSIWSTLHTRIGAPGRRQSGRSRSRIPPRRQLAGDAQEVNERLLQIAQLRTPPTPVPREKRIEVSIAQQRLYAYEDDELVFEFICSTGMYSSPTQAGSYEVLDKIPMAYGSTWDLDMPFWMGIYWSGTLENGIHALPILANGQLLWEGYLGQPASYGCVILSTEDAETLYDWAEVGVPVIIY